MRVGVLGGTGPAGSALAARLAAAGLDVLIGSRDPERAASTCADVRARWPDLELALHGVGNDAAAGADIVIVATPWDAAAATTGACAKALAGKVVISMANALVKTGDELQAITASRGSVAASIQLCVPEARVAAAFQHLPARELGDLAHHLEADVLVCSDHADATAATLALVGKVPGLRGVDCGRLSNAAPLEAFVAVLLEVNRRYKTRASLRLTGLADEA